MRGDGKTNGVSHRMLTRREALRSMSLALVVLSGCAQVPQLAVAGVTPVAVRTPSAIPVPTAIPTATALPRLDTPKDVAAEYLRRWSTGNYVGMYELIAHTGPGTTDETTFVNRYRNVFREATIIELTATLEPEQRADANIQRFRLKASTVLAGTIEQSIVMTLVYDRDHWRVQWLPSLIFKELSGDNLVHMFIQTVPRGEIVDATGTMLAGAGHAVSVGVVSGKIIDDDVLVYGLSNMLHMTPDAVRRQYRQAPADSAVPIRVISAREAEPIRAELLKIPGVLLSDLLVRTYPSGTLAAATIGYLDQVNESDLDRLARSGYQPGDLVGRSGAEAWGEPYLAGVKGGKLMVTTKVLQEVATISSRPSYPADRITLTLDRRLQAAAEEALRAHVGAVVFMRIADGALYVMANAPGFDPNSFLLGMTQEQWIALNHDAKRPLVNRSADMSYPAGPIAHLATLAVAFDRNLVQLDTTITCTGSWMPSTGVTPLPCWKQGGHGTITVGQGLLQSCDIAAYHLGRQIDEQDRQVLPALMRDFGFGKLTGVIGCDEDRGFVPDAAWKRREVRAPWSSPDAAELAAGRGAISATALQVATIMASVALGNTVVTPRLVTQAIAPNGAPHFTAPSYPPARLPVSDATLTTLREILRDSAPTGGAGFAMPTAALMGPTSGIRGADAGVWFTGFAPIERPEVSVAVFLEGPREQPTAAATVAKAVIAAYRATR